MILQLIKVIVNAHTEINGERLRKEFQDCDVGQNILINFCNLLYFVFLRNFRYFRFRAFISLFFGVFNVVQSNQGFICFRSRLRVSSCPRFCFYYLNALQPPKAIQFFYTIINKHRCFVKFSSGGFQFYSPCGFSKTPRGFKIYYQELTVQFLFHQKSIVCTFFRFPRHQTVKLLPCQIITHLQPCLLTPSYTARTTTSIGIFNNKNLC